MSTTKGMVKNTQREKPSKMGFTLKDIQNSAVGHLNAHLFQEQVEAKKSKFRNTKTEVNGIKFDSKKEAEYYKKLLILLKAGEIGFLELQVPFELNDGGTHSLKYVADFVWTDSHTGERIVCDVKGFRTVEYRKKRRLMLKIHNIKIKEV
jgi:Ni,Fe-hydrogenase III component G